MTDILLLIIVSIILVETSLILVSRRPVAGGFRGERAILVDTSVLIDGRILDIAEAGFVPGRLVIPRSVLGELQLLADGSDHEKRNRARNGLEVITKLQAIPRVTVEIYGDQSDAREGVDNRLLALSRKLGYELCTVDYNLQKVAQAESITILSINELSQKLRALYLPGEKVELTLKQKGQEKGQAIGYASDGTMVVVDNADKLMNQTVTVEIIRSLQTNSGKMMFAKLESADPQTPRALQAFSTEKPQQAARLPRTPRAPRPERTERTSRDRDNSVERNNQTDNTNRERAPKKIFSRNRRSQNASQSPEDNLLDLVNKQ